MDNTIEKRQSKNKEQLLEILKKTPIVQIACEKAGVGRATYYRWRKDDPRIYPSQRSWHYLMEAFWLMTWPSLS